MIYASVKDADAQQRAADQVSEATGGKLDVLINNAALLRSDPDTTWKTMDAIPAKEAGDMLTQFFESNVIGIVNTTNAFLPLIRAGAAKKVIVLATGHADLDLVNKYALRHHIGYAVTKAATNMVVGKYHASLGRSENILFLSLSPGAVDNQMSDQMSEEEAKGVMEMIGQFKQYAPHFERPLTVEESVNAMTAVIDRATVAEFGGAFVSHNGDDKWL
jgi:NAD(P)-dependent dehydrogenase (short-subunit alcohol dehydrogenase family)